MFRTLLYKLLYVFLIIVSSVKFSHAQLGTASGTDISTAFTIAYTVSSQSQSDTITSQTFETSKKVDLLLSTTLTTGTNAKPVTPSQTFTSTEFVLTNQSNYQSSFTFTATITEAAEVFVGSPTATIWQCVGACDTATGGDDTQITTYVSLTSGSTLDIAVRSSANVETATNVAQSSEASFNLTATATDLGTTTATTQTSGAYDKTVVQTVFSDDAGIGTDAIYDGKHSVSAYVKIYKSALSVALTPVVVFTNDTVGDNKDCATEPAGNSEAEGRAIPGACMKLTYVLTNGAGGATATAIDWTIDIPSQLTYVGEVDVSAAANDAACTDSGGFDTTGAAPDGTIVCNISSLAASASVSVTFRATID